MQIHSTAPALFALFLLLDGDDKPPWLSIALGVLYIQIYLTFRPEREKKVSLEYFPTAPSLPLGLVDAHRLLPVREGGDRSQLLGPLRTSSLGSSRFCHHGSESYRWMTKAYSSLSGSEDPDGQRPLWFARQGLLSFCFLIICFWYLD